jgi:hypothetical protein
MAQTKPAARLSFYEIVFKGDPKYVRAFLSGLFMGTDQDSTVFFSFLEGVHHEGKAEHLAEMFHIRHADCHVIVDSATNTYLKKLSKRMKNEAGLEILCSKRIKSASLEFCFHAYAPKYEAQIMELLKARPAALKLKDFKHEVKVDPTARGVEAYSATHDFEAEGHGTITGRVDLVIEMKKKFADIPLIESKDVELTLA